MSSTNARTEKVSEAGTADPAAGGPDSIGSGPRPARRAEPRRATLRGSLLAAGGLLVLGMAAIPIDGAVSAAAGDLRHNLIGGDLRRELEALQQFGQGASTLLIAWAIWLLDPPRRRRLLDWFAGAALAAIVAYPMKMLVGRPRPRFEDPGYFAGPFGAYPLGPEVGVRHAWEVWAGISSDLWSMPSTHTVYAVVAAVVLATLYPRLRPLVIVMACLVGVSRVLFGAHYLSDVLVGAALGLAAGAVAVRTFLGVRAIDALWRKTVNRSAAPALPGVVAHESTRR